MSHYPPLAHTLAALVGYAFFGSPIIGMTTVALMSVFGTYLLIAKMSDAEQAPSSLIASFIFIAIIGLFRGSGAFVGGEIVGNFFFAQVVGFFTVLAIALAILDGRVSPWVGAALAIVATFALGYLFPMAAIQFACIALACNAIVLIDGVVSGAPWRLPAVRLAGLMVALPAAIVLHPRFPVMLKIADHEGGFSVSRSPLFVGTLIVALGVLTVALLALRLRSRVRPPLVLVAVCAGIFGAAAAQAAAKVVGIGSFYGVAKHVFPVATMAAIAFAMVIACVLPTKRLTRWGQTFNSRFAFVVPPCVAVIAVAFVLPSHGRSLRLLENQHQFIEYALQFSLPKDARGNSVSTNLQLSRVENYALSIGDFAEPKMGALVHTLGEDIFGADTGLVISQNPVLYRLLSDDAPGISPACIKATGAVAGAIIIDEKCQPANGGYRLGDWIVAAQILPGGFRYFKSGWSSMETWGIWNSETAAVLSFPALLDPPSRLRLEIEGTAFIGVSKAQQTVIAEIAGHRIGEWQFSSAKQPGISVEIPSSLVATGVPLEISFQFPDATVPSGDARHLALGIKRMRLSPVSDQ